MLTQSPMNRPEVVPVTLNSIDAGQSAEIVNPAVFTTEPTSRKSIVGSDRDRNEVLTSMKKGILKSMFSAPRIYIQLLTEA
jgi:hypothetical protein